MSDVYVIVRFRITQGDADGDEVLGFATLDEAQQAFDAGRASGEYVDEGDFWSGATAYLLGRRSAAGYFDLDGTSGFGPYGLLAAPTITSAALGSKWSSDPARCGKWPT